MGIGSRTHPAVWRLVLLIAAWGYPNLSAYAQTLKTGELERVETAAFVFYFPSGFESAPPRVEKTVVYIYSNKRGDSINVSRFDYLAGRELDQELCRHLARQFDQSQLRTVIRASEAKGIEFKHEGGTRSCYYRYEFPRGDSKSHVEYKVYQMKGREAYAITAVYSDDSPDQTALQEALHSFTIKVATVDTPAGNPVVW